MSNKISISEFQKLDIRIGTVVKAEVPKWSHWVIKLTVDFASEAKSTKDRSSRHVRIEPESREGRSGGEKEIGKRTVFVGMMKFFKPSEFENRQFPFVINIEPKKIGPEGDFSEGMMLAANLVEKGVAADEGRPILFNLQEKVPNGTKVL